MLANTGSLVDLAKEILRNAETLEAELDKAGLPQPSTAVNGPLQYPKASEHSAVYNAREGLVLASEAMLNLSRGPAETMRSKLCPERLFTPILQVIIHFNIHKIVPEDGSSIAITDLATTLNIDPGPLSRILHLSFLSGLFHSPTPGHIEHNALSQAISLLEGYIWLQSRPDINAGTYAWPTALSNHNDPSALRTPLHIANGSATPFFTYLASEPNGHTNFAASMRDHSRVTGADTALLTTAFDWSRLGAGPVIDLGGGAGHAACVIARVHPQLHIVVQDLPENATAADETIPGDLKERVTFRAGDFFEPQPQTPAQQGGAPGLGPPRAFFLKGVLHDWSDEDCVRILRHLLPFVEEGAKIVICERVPPGPGEERTTLDALKVFMDVLMWTIFGTKERGRADWEALLGRVDARFQVEMRRVVGNEFGIVVAGF